MLALVTAPSSLVISKETWAELWPDARPLAELHFDEVDSGVEPRRRLEVDTEQMALAALLGVLHCWTARRAGVLLGYILWTTKLDAESKGLLVAEMGPWFVLPGSEAGLGGRLFDTSLAGLRELGCQLAFPHHRCQGRGSALGSFFEARGGKLMQKTYSLWIGDPNA